MYMKCLYILYILCLYSLCVCRWMAVSVMLVNTIPSNMYTTCWCHTSCWEKSCSMHTTSISYWSCFKSAGSGRPMVLGRVRIQIHFTLGAVLYAHNYKTISIISIIIVVMGMAAKCVCVGQGGGMNMKCILLLYR